MSTWGVLRRIVPSLRVQFVLAALSFGAVPALVPQACQAYQHQARVLQYRYDTHHTHYYWSKTQAFGLGVRCQGLSTNDCVCVWCVLVRPCL